MCRRDAISGTTPPYSAWVSICVSTTLERMVRPSSMTAAAVSSQEDSSAKILIVSPVIFVLQNMTRQRRVVLMDIDTIFTRVLHMDAHEILPLEQAAGIVPHLGAERNARMAERLLRLEKFLLRIGAQNLLPILPCDHCTATLSSASYK